MQGHGAQERGQAACTFPVSATDANARPGAASYDLLGTYYPIFTPSKGGDVPAWKEIKHAVQCGSDLGEGDRQTSELS